MNLLSAFWWANCLSLKKDINVENEIFFKWLFLRAFDWEILIYAFYISTIHSHFLHMPWIFCKDSSLKILFKIQYKKILPMHDVLHKTCKMFWMDSFENEFFKMYIFKVQTCYSVLSTHSSEIKGLCWMKWPIAIFLDKKLPSSLFFVLKVNVNKHRPLATGRSSKT